MNISAFALGEQLNNRKVQFVLHRPLWDTFNYPNIDISFANWQSIKYLNDDGTGFNPDIASVPNDSGGLYLFFVKCPVIRGLTEYPLYIGRAQLTQGQNLRKRVKEYFQHWSKDNERPKIFKMFQYWRSELHLAFFPLEENEEIVDLERDIINSTLFDLNDQIPEKAIKEAIKAFN